MSEAVRCERERSLLAEKTLVNRRRNSKRSRGSGYEVAELEPRLLLSGALFSAPYQTPYGSGSDSIATADFNGDGKMDLATSGYTSGLVTVVMNQGDGTFPTGRLYLVGNAPYDRSYPNCIAAGDINGDGKPDLVTANEGKNTVSVLLNLGDGTFAAPVTYAVGTVPTSVALADFNNDGKVDIATTNEAANTVSVLLNQGNGTFAPAASYAVGGFPYSIAAVDVSGDGRPDLVTANRQSNTVSVLVNQGNGTFGRMPDWAVGGNPYSIAAGDFNGDGKMDLVTANGLTAGAVSVLLNQGNGMFAAASNYSVGTGPSSVAVADLDGDGKMDIVTTSPSDKTVSVLLNQGGGTFSAATGYPAGTQPASIIAADLNGDGAVDLAMGDASTSGSVLLNQSAAQSPPAVQDASATAGADELQLTWAHTAGAIRYNIYRATAPGAESSTPLATNGFWQTSYLDTSVVAGVTYYYTVTALNGSYEGAASPEASATPFLPVINTAVDGDAITLSPDADHVHIDWAAANASGRVRINDPLGLTINGDSGNDPITLSNANSLPNTLHLNGTFTVTGLSGSNPLAGTTLALSKQSTVYLAYASAASDPIAPIKAALQAGYNTGTWTGMPSTTTGVITSSAAAANPTQLAIGYADAADPNNPDTIANTIELKTTLVGDANLDGSVNFSDLLAVTRCFGHGSNWDQGDFNYDGSTNLSDFLALTRNFGKSLSAVLPTVTADGSPAPVRTSLPAARRRL